MTHILFVCHGNICRSPMAEFIMKDLIRKAGCEKEITVDSVAATTEEIGHDMYPPATGDFEETYDDLVEGCRALLGKQWVVNH